MSYGPMQSRFKKKRDINKEVDLVAFISLLSVCICFLLLTTVWIQIGSMGIKQALGGGDKKSKPSPEMWVTFTQKGALNLKLRNAPQSIMKPLGHRKIPSQNGAPDWAQLESFLSQLKEKYRTLSVALIRPDSQTSFQDIVQTMDIFRKNGVKDLGLMPI